MAGYLGRTNLSLELIDLAAGKRIPVKPQTSAGERWLNCYVKAPPGEFKIVAHDASEAAWFAFKAPREMGRLSVWATRALEAWRCFLFAGLGLLLLDLATSLARHRAHDDSDLPAASQQPPAKPQPKPTRP